jgi:phosphoribosyl 1,2-cyclic phosphodiesterase
MALFIASLNSGSNGNCYYVGNEEGAVLVDAGLSCKEIERRMDRLGLSMSLVRGVIITHEHDDHIRGVEVLSRRHRLPVYITEPTLQNGRLSLDKQLVRIFSGPQTIDIGCLQITTFPKSHDAADPYSVIVGSASVWVGVFTDIGLVCDNVIRHFMRCHAVFLESNYDESMLEQGRYPYPLKRRIRGGQGHLSNRQALELFVAYRPAFLSHLLLAHLSQDNNRPELVQSLFEEQAGGTKVVVASRHHPSEVYRVDGHYIGVAGPEWNVQGVAAAAPVSAPTMQRRRKGLGVSSTQISLFREDPC